MLVRKSKMLKGHIAWTLGLASAVAFFLLGYSVGHLGNKAQSFSSMRFFYSQSTTTLEPHSIDSSHFKKQMRPLDHGDEGGISMHTIFMSGCDKWQVRDSFRRSPLNTLLSVSLASKGSLTHSNMATGLGGNWAVLEFSQVMTIMSLLPCFQPH